MTGPDEVQLASTLIAAGRNYASLARQATRGELSRVRHGAYAEVLPPDAQNRHRQLIAASVPRLDDAAVLSHSSAALLHGLPVWSEHLDRVHVTRDRSYGGRIGATVHVHPAVLLPTEVTVLNGRLVTSLARTTSDLLRTLDRWQAVSVGDAALRAGLSPAELAGALERSSRRRGARRGRAAAAFLDARAESVGESFSRVVFDDEGLPAPEPQYEFRDPLTGALVARSDFGWEEHRTLGEFDGRSKYGALLTTGQTAGDALFAEKRREEMLRDLGWQIVRWLWEDLWRPQLLARRLRDAFARGERLRERLR